MSKFKNLMSKIVIVFAMAFMFGILGNGNVYAASVGQQLTTPESGWQRIDDTNPYIIYSGFGYGNGNWGTYTDSKCSGGSSKYNGAGGAANLEFNFIGSKIRWIGNRASNGTKSAKISIDGIDNTFSYIGDDLLQSMVFEKTGLEFREHHVVISSPGDGGYINFDAIDIDANGQLIDPKVYKKVTTIALNKSALQLNVGQTDSLIANITPTDATIKAVTWKSSDESIATVDSTGKVTAIKEGTVTITATTQDGSNLSASCVVTVKPKDTTPTNPTETGNAILTITMTNGNVKSYTVSMTKVNDFISWYNNRSSGSNGSPYYAFDKTDNLQPFTKKTEYIVFDKISSFEVDEYSK